jgi:hypothetical protein
MDRTRNSDGQFVREYSEPRAKTAIAFRLPESVDRELRQLLGWESSADNKQLHDWVAEAVRQRVVRNRQRGRKF